MAYLSRFGEFFERRLKGFSTYMYDMGTINLYLTFDGNCEEAFNFYKSVFGGEFEQISRFGDMPPDPDYPVKEQDKNKIMHVSLAIGKE